MQSPEWLSPLKPRGMDHCSQRSHAGHSGAQSRAVGEVGGEPGKSPGQFGGPPAEPGDVPSIIEKFLGDGLADPGAATCDQGVWHGYRHEPVRGSATRTYLMACLKYV